MELLVSGIPRFMTTLKGGAACAQDYTLLPAILWWELCRLYAGNARMRVCF